MSTPLESQAELFKKLQRIESARLEMQRRLIAESHTGLSPDGYVKLTLKGSTRLEAVQIDPLALSELDAPTLSQHFIDAYVNAVDKIAQRQLSSMNEIAEMAGVSVQELREIIAKMQAMQQNPGVMP